MSQRAGSPAEGRSAATRRTWLEWLGRSTVLALSAELAQACGVVGSDGAGARADLSALLDAARHRDTDRRDGAAEPDGSADAAAGRDSAGPDAGPDAARDAAPDAVRDAAPDAAPSGFAFAPGAGDAPVFVGWGERTVDPQDLAGILAGWELRVDGLVESPLTLSFADVLALPRMGQVTDFHCVEGWSVWDVPWNGVRLADLLARVRPLATATHVVFHTLGGTYNESLPLAVALEPRSLLGYGVAGSTLPLAHGFPLRVVVPRLLGYKNAKYVERVELTAAPLEGFWVRAGYPYAGEVPPERLREGRW